MDVKTAAGVKRQEVTVNDGDDLQQTTKRAIYADFRVGEINTARDEEFLELRYPGGEVMLAVGQAYGDVDALAVSHAHVSQAQVVIAGIEQRAGFVDAMRFVHFQSHAQQGEFEQISEVDFVIDDEDAACGFFSSHDLPRR